MVALVVKYNTDLHPSRVKTAWNLAVSISFGGASSWSPYVGLGSLKCLVQLAVQPCYLVIFFLLPHFVGGEGIWSPPIYAWILTGYSCLVYIYIRRRRKGGVTAFSFSLFFLNFFMILISFEIAG